MVIILPPEYEHWAETISKNAIKMFGNEQIVSAGWSPSGIYHIGNSREAVTCSAINRSLRNQGAKSKFIFVIDDFDPLDKIPSNLKKYSKELRPFLGHPLRNIPDFTGTTDSYADYFAKGAIEAMEDFRFDVDFKYASNLYKRGKYDEYLKIYFNKSDKLDELFQAVTGSVLDSYLSVICQNCGNLKTSKISKVETDQFYYYCESENMFRGCSYEGKASISSHQWKLKWRLDWPARQSFLGVTVEPSGKDHSVAGGSVDTALSIHNEIFEQKPPLLERYGFITFQGKKLSGSKGGALPATEIKQIMPPSVYLFLIYRSDLLKDIDFNPESSQYTKLMNEYDIARSMYHGVTFEGRDREHHKLATAADLSMSSKERDFIPSSVKYEELALIYQTSLNNTEITIEKLEEMDKFPNEAAKKEIKNRLGQLDIWLKEYAPPSLKFKFLDYLPEDINKYWTKEVKNVWLKALAKVDEKSYPEELASQLRKIGKQHGVLPKKYYQAFYKLITGNLYGPNAANLVMAIGVERVKDKIRDLND